MTRPRTRALVALAIWDGAWKALAVAVAVRNRQWRWVGPLLAMNSGGLLPMLYLWRFAAARSSPQKADPGPQ
ncbi:MAG: hypothetical protein IT304_01815 [Dehalococcoidia bacterium]|nr:hypothetical protein [Dehalococcoidia bacterium]